MIHILILSIAYRLFLKLSFYKVDIYIFFFFFSSFAFLKINKIKLNITKEYVLNGQFPDKELRYSERSVNEVLKQLGEKAGIKKRIYAHLIRHCFATHSVENGTDINLLQKLLGHSNVKTTNIYLHISHNHISKINSPVNAIRL